MLAIFAATLLLGLLWMPAALAKPPPGGGPPANPEIAFVNLAKNKVMVMNADGTNVATVYNGGANANLIAPTWSPDGTAIAFMQGPSLGSELWRVNVAVVGGTPTGSNPTQIATNVYFTPAWSPAGDAIAFPTWDLACTCVSSVVTIPAAGGAPTTVYTVPAGRDVHDPTWSADASRIAWVESDGSATSAYTLRVLTLGTGTVVDAYSTTSYFFALDWARTKDVLAFSRGSPQGIFTVDISGPSPTPQSVVPGDARFPSWSPDDTKLVFAKPVNNKFKVQVYNFGTGSVTALAEGWHPDWQR